MAEGLLYPQTCYATELNDDIWHYRFVSRKDLLFQLKLNLLFFGSVAQGAATLLSHRVLYDLVQTEPDAIRELLTRGALMPIFLRQGDTFQKVANRMMEEKSLSWLNPDELLRHAELLDGARYRGVTDDGREIHEEQFAKIHQIVELLESANGPSTLFGASLPRPGQLRWFLKWLDSNKEGKIRISQVHRFLDSRAQRAGPSAAHARILALAVHSEVMRRGQFSALSAFRRFNPYVALLGRIEGELPSGSVEGAVAPLSAETIDIETRLPFEEVAALPFRGVTWLGGQSSFNQARRLLHHARVKGLDVDRVELRSCLDAAYGDVRKYVSKTPETRDLLPHLEAQAKSRSKVRLACVSAAAIGPGVAAAALHLVPKLDAILLTVFGPMLPILADYLIKPKVPFSVLDYGTDLLSAVGTGKTRRYDAITGAVTDSG